MSSSNKNINLENEILTGLDTLENNLDNVTNSTIDNKILSVNSLVNEITTNFNEYDIKINNKIDEYNNINQQLNNTLTSLNTIQAGSTNMLTTLNKDITHLNNILTEVSEKNAQIATIANSSQYQTQLTNINNIVSKLNNLNL